VIKRKTLSELSETQLVAETDLLKSIDHPNIVKLFEIYADTKHYYLITEYCSGGSLFDRIKTMTSYNEKLTS